MDAPRGRYRVEEKDGRLVVIDTATGAPATSVTPPPTPRAGGATGPGVIARPPGLVDRYGRLLLGLVVKSWDSEGRAVIAWEWEQNGRKQRWDAALDPTGQKRMGRALAAVSAFPLLILLSIFAGFGLAFFLLPVALPATFWGIWAIMRLQRETERR
ncbi:MAG TPA: hypothetical protein VEW26_09810 [Allosphingosinicella sp.]|nr:hypothetical protein [Allosphingosinicella sp.]